MRAEIDLKPQQNPAPPASQHTPRTPEGTHRMPNYDEPKLRPKQHIAVNLILQGLRDQEVAEAVGVTRQTVNQWRNRDPVFIAELNRRRRTVWEEEADRVRALSYEAVSVLSGLMKSPDERVRLRAACNLLRTVPLYASALYPEGPEYWQEVDGAWQDKERYHPLRCRQVESAWVPHPPANGNIKLSAAGT